MSQEAVSKISSRAEREIGLATGEIQPTNRLENQIRLASQLYKSTHEGYVDLHSPEIRNEIMFSWAAGGDDSLSRAYSDLEKDSRFMLHERLQGNIFNITTDDVVHYRDHHELLAA